VSSVSSVLRELGKFPVDEITDRRAIILPDYDDVADRNVVVVNLSKCYGVEMGLTSSKW
jgi:hypothetical protein